jgi:hypothetical protein
MAISMDVVFLTINLPPKPWRKGVATDWIKQAPYKRKATK